MEIPEEQRALTFRGGPRPRPGSHSVAWIVCARLPVPVAVVAPCRPARSMMAGAGSGRSAGIDIIDSSIISIDNIDIDTNDYVLLSRYYQDLY